MKNCEGCYKIYENNDIVVLAQNDMSKILEIFKTNEISMIVLNDEHVFNFMFSVYDKQFNNISLECKYITPLFHLLYSKNYPVILNINEKSLNKYKFILKNEFYISLFGHLYLNGKFIDCLYSKFSFNEIKYLEKPLVDYIIEWYIGDEINNQIISNPFKGINILIGV